MVEDPNVKGNRISCRFYQGEVREVIKDTRIY